MRKVPVGLFSLLIAAGLSSCGDEDLKQTEQAEQSGDAVKLVVNWCSYEDLVSPLMTMRDMLHAAQSETRAADPDQTIDSYMDQWEVFKYAVEPRPYVYDDHRTTVVILDDFEHDKRKNVYEWWFRDQTDTGGGTRPLGTWKIRRKHTELKVELAVDRYWADPAATGGWKHTVAASAEGGNAADRVIWIQHAGERLTNYRATYTLVQTLSSEFKKFLQDNNLFNESALKGRILYEDMMSFLASNLGSDIIIDDGVAEGTTLPEGLFHDAPNRSEDDLKATYAYLLPSLVLDRLVLERQQIPFNGFTSMHLPEPPPLHPTEPNDPSDGSPPPLWTRGVASRGMLFEFFFGAITPTFAYPGDPYRPFD